MTSRLASIALVLLLAAPLRAELQTVLAPDSTLYAIDGAAEQERLEVARRIGDKTEALLVPGTDDEAIESEARLLWDGATSTLFVVWHSVGADRDAILLATFDAEGKWSEPVEIASSASQRRAGLQAVLARATVTSENEEGSTSQATLIHAAWWSVGSELTAEYALVAFEAGQHVSTEVAKLDDLAAIRSVASLDELEETGAPLHPPLAIARSAAGAVEIVYGAPSSTRLTRVRVEPRRVAGDARIWRPGRSESERTGPARLIAADAAPVQAFISKGRIALYDPAGKFRYVVYENGKWTPERMIQLDAQVTSDKLLRELRRVVEEEPEAATDAVEQK
ncbi:MAG TPA: hypothetical protein VF846_15015 [Thermoanaerobaculia bacterium]|jgi:hypothetical protein